MTIMAFHQRIKQQLKLKRLLWTYPVRFRIVLQGCIMLEDTPLGMVIKGVIVREILERGLGYSKPIN